MPLSQDQNVVYKYNVQQPPLNPDDFEESTYMLSINAEAVQPDYDWHGNEIMIVSYGRSGTHMAWYLVRYMLQGGTKTIPDIMAESYYPPYWRLEGSPQTGPRRLLSCHLLPCQFTSDSLLQTGNRKFLYLIRNPLDVAVSAYNLYKEFKGMHCMPSTFSEYYTQFIRNTAKTFPFVGWFTHVKAWEEYATKNPDVPIMFQMYEDLVRNPRESLHKIAEFLNIEVSERFLDDLVEASKFSNMRKNKVDETTESFFKSDANTALYRKGVIGDWKNWLTVKNYEFFQNVFPEQSSDLACKDKLIFT